MKCVAVACASVALLAPAAATAKTVILHWRETAEARSGYPRLTFTVTSISFGRRGWSVRASMTNRSRENVTIVTERSPYLTHRFGLFVPAHERSRPLPETVSDASSFREAVAFEPRVPAMLRRGETWRGTFSGRGTVRRGTLVGVTFGAFVLRRPPWAFSWTTTHAVTR